jgi:hypothetical protein
MKKLILTLFLSAIYLAASPIGTGAITLTGVNGANVDDYFVSPYYAQLGSQNLTVYCVDFLDSVSTGESWPIDIYSGTMLPTEPFPSADYPVLFWLAQQDTPANYITTQLAMWTETDPGFSDATPASNALLATAIADAGSVDLSEWDVLIPVTNTGQVFIVDAVEDAPEPGSVFLLVLSGAGLLLLRKK